ncbi:MAG: Rap1a immunity protein [Gammaproteobacteria bacterium]|nr:Rap1a immunity protein [Gammaproteobacteria bacterium]
MILLALPVHADATNTAMELYNWCKADQGTDSSLWCALYINGYWRGATAGAVEVYHNLGISQKDVSNKRIFCIPDNVSVEQIKLIFNRYAEDHPEELNNDVTSVLARAIMSGFCKNKR